MDRTRNSLRCCLHSTSAAERSWNICTVLDRRDGSALKEKHSHALSPRWHARMSGGYDHLSGVEQDAEQVTTR